MALNGDSIGSGQMSKTFAMSKGDDENSYSKNSDAQKSVVDEVMGRLDEALQVVRIPLTTEAAVVQVADLGCSSGTNSIRHIAHLIQTLRTRISSAGDGAREFQAFFNDLPSNDFNNLFQFWNSESKDSFFAAGVPGSFYGRLFPNSSVHVFFSTWCVHFLSEIPKVVYEHNTNNGYSYHLNEAPRPLLDAYQKRAAMDLETFLHARAAELSQGGLLFFLTKGRRAGGKGPRVFFDINDPVEAGFDSLTTTLNELYSKGLLTKEQMSAFAFPLYIRDHEELQSGFDSCKSEFEVHSAEFVEVPLFADLKTVKSGDIDRAALLARACGVFKGVFGGYLEGMMGKELAKVFWDTYAQVVERDSLPAFLTLTTVYVVAMIRK